MAPIEHDLANSNFRPLAALSAYLTVTTSLLALIGHRVLYRSYKALPPSQGTRARQVDRRKHVSVYVGLSVLSFGFAFYYLEQLLTISYQVWAYERGVAVPTAFWHEDGGSILRHGALQLGRWYQDTNIIAEFWEVGMQTTRQQWWTQQLLLSGSTWALYVAMEGRRRNIPHLWAFVALSGLISLSFAQNLFFLAILLTPVPMSEADKSTELVHKTSAPGGKGDKHIRNLSRTVRSTSTPVRIRDTLDYYLPAKPADWAPHSLIWTIPLIVSGISTILAGFAVSTPQFNSMISLVVITMFAPLFVHARAFPRRFGKSNSSLSVTGARALTAFRIIGIFSLAVHLSRSAVAIIDNSESQHRYHYFWREKRSRLTETTDTLGDLLGALTDHAGIGRIAWDALLSGFSLIVWAGTRGIAPSFMLRSAGLATKAELKLAKDAKDFVQKEVAQLVNNVSDEDNVPSVPSVRSRKSAPRKPSRNIEFDAGEHGAMANAYDGDVTQRWKGDEIREEDWEAGTLAWGMLVLGGLGSATAGVLGAEVI